MADLTGFKETEIGPIPVEWEVVRLGEIAEKRKFAIVDGPFQIGTYQPNKKGITDAKRAEMCYTILRNQIERDYRVAALVIPVPLS